jgi:hypothetical protein
MLSSRHRLRSCCCPILVCAKLMNARQLESCLAQFFPGIAIDGNSEECQSGLPVNATVYIQDLAA